MKPADGPVPRLRFPEFRDAGPWEVKRLEKYVEQRAGNANLIKGRLYAEPGHGRFPGFSASGQDVWLDTFEHAGPAIIVSAVGARCGRCFLADGKWSAIANTHILFPQKSDIDIRFLFEVVTQDGFWIISGSGQPFVKVRDSLRQEVLLPSLPEQHKIADCLASLDDLIRAEGEALAALKVHKRGLMQRLFPRPGETTPRLRFPEFRDAGPWEVKRLGEVCEMFSGGTPATGNADFYGGGIPFIRSAEIGLAETELSLTDAGLLNSSAKLVESGDVLLALYGANSGDAALSAISGAINQAILCMRPRNLIKTYLYQFLDYWKSLITSKYLQGGQGNLSAEIISSLATSFPQIAEQQKIAACLSSLDDLIRAQGARLEALKAHKRGLMQQLFPQGIA